MFPQGINNMKALVGGAVMARKIREGLIPTVLGTAVTAVGLAAYGGTSSIAGAAVTGFGLAHIVLGGIDLATHGKNE